MPQYGKLVHEPLSGRGRGRGLGLGGEQSYTGLMRRVIPAFVALLLMGLSTAPAADPRLVDGVSGAPIAWTDWVAKRGPVAVLVWASWAPNSKATIERHASLAKACADAGLYLVVLDVQETLEDGRAALDVRDIGWLHDRHGALLKRYRVIDVPSLLLVAADGEPLAKLAATPEAVRGWSGP